MVSVVGVHVAHLSDVPDFHGSVIRYRVKLIILFVETDPLREYVTLK